MADEVRETVFEHISGEKSFTFSSSEKKWINEINRLKKKYPDDVDIAHINGDGSIYGHLPGDWIRVKPKKKVNMTDEQREASKARLEMGRKKRLQSGMEGDTRADSGKELDAYENNA